MVSSGSLTVVNELYGALNTSLNVSCDCSETLTNNKSCCCYKKVSKKKSCCSEESTVAFQISSLPRASKTLPEAERFGSKQSKTFF